MHHEQRWLPVRTNEFAQRREMRKCKFARERRELGCGARLLPLHGAETIAQSGKRRSRGTKERRTRAESATIDAHRGGIHGVDARAGHRTEDQS